MRDLEEDEFFTYEGFLEYLKRENYPLGELHRLH